MDTYKSTNTLNGRFYIGSTNNFEKRKKEHLASRENYPFQNALRKNPEAFEWECWSDDSDEPILEQALLDMWFGCEQCYNLNPQASRPPVDPERSRRNCLKLVREERGLHKPGYIGSEEHLNACRKGGETALKEKKGLFKYLGSETHRKKARETGKRAREEKTGIFDPKAVQKRMELLSSPVQITFASGEIAHFVSLRQASKETGIHRDTLNRLSDTGDAGKRGKVKGIKVKLLEA